MRTIKWHHVSRLRDFDFKPTDTVLLYISRGERFLSVTAYRDESQWRSVETGALLRWDALWYFAHVVDPDVSVKLSEG